MIPQFPEFKNLEITDKEEIENITKQFPPHSDFHFISIYCWDIDNSTLISTLNENLILKQIDCLTGEQFFSLIGINSVQETINKISDFLSQNNLPLVLRWVPEETVACLNGTEAIVTEDRDYFDYVYNVEDFHNAVGGKYKSYRKNISSFIRNNPNITTRLLDLSNKHVRIQINSLFNNWVEKKEKRNKDCEPQFECKAINKLLLSSIEFNSLIALGVYHNEELIAFAIEDFIDIEFGCCLFWKANLNYLGIYHFLQKEVTKLYHENGIKLMNWESDLGLESLRTSKLRYNPAFFLKKYKIEMCVPVESYK